MKISPQTGLICSVMQRVGPAFRKYFTVVMTLGLLLAAGESRVEAQDDDYLTVYAIIDQADQLNASGKIVQAHNKYIEARGALVTFQQTYPDWNPGTVGFRLKYIDQKLAATKPGAKGGAVGVAAPSPVRLLEAGSEPRAVLRLHPAVGDHLIASMNMQMGMEMTMGTNKVPAMKLPAMLMKMDTTVKAISPTGDISYELVLGDATVDADTNAPPAVVEAMKTGLAGLQGATGTGEISSHGIAKELKMNVPDDVSPQLSQALSQMKDSMSSSSIALPEEPVGPGAKWEYVTRINTQGMKIDMVMDYELVSVDGDALILRTTVKESAAKQTVESPAAPGVKVNLVKMSGMSTGSSTMHLNQILPAEATVDGSTVMTMEIGKQIMDMKMNLNLSLEAK